MTPLEVQASEDRCESRETVNYRQGSGFQIKTYQYYPTQERVGTGQMVIIVPPTNGTNGLDRDAAEAFCKYGLPAVILDSWTNSSRHPSVAEPESHQYEIDQARRALLILTNNVFSNTQIGILATSKGAIGVAAYASEFRSNVKSVFLIVAGAPLHLAISRAGERGLRDLRAARASHFELQSQRQYDQMIAQSLTSSIPTSRPRSGLRVAMVISDNDTTVPTYLQENLMNQWRPDRLWRRPGNHRQVVLFSFTMLKKRMFEFFDESFSN